MKPLCQHLTAFPCKILFFLSDEIEGLEEGDRIYSYYEYNGQYYASFEREVYYNSRVVAIGMAFNHGETSYDNPNNFKFGFNHNEIVNWGIYRNGVMFKLQVTDEYNQQGAGEFSFKYAKGIVTNEVVDVKDNLFYSLDPVWRYEDGKVTTYSETPNLNHKIDLTLFRPARKESCVVSVVNGHGEVKSPDKFSAYYLTIDDLYEGEVKFAVDVVPYRNSTFTDTHREYTFKFPAKVKPTPRPKPVKKYQFNDFKKEVNELTVSNTLVSGVINNPCTAILRYREGGNWVLENFTFDNEDIHIPIDGSKTVLPYCWVTFYTNDYKGRQFALTLSIKL